MSLYFGYDPSSPASEDVVVLKDGKVNKPIDMGKFKITQSAPPTNNNDLANKKYVDDTSESVATSISTNSQASLVASGDALKGTAKGNINMDTYSITQSAQPSNANHLSNKGYVDRRINSVTTEREFEWRVYTFNNILSVNGPVGCGNDSSSPSCPITYVPKVNTYIRINSITFGKGNIAAPNMVVGVYLKMYAKTESTPPRITQPENVLFDFNTSGQDAFELPDEGATKVYSYRIGRDFLLGTVYGDKHSHLKSYYIRVRRRSGPTGYYVTISACLVEK